MKADLHIHSKDCSDGKMRLPEIFEEAHERRLKALSITDHDAIHCQETAMSLASEYGMHYLPGVELNISFSHPRYRSGKPVSLDVLGYGIDVRDKALMEKLEELRAYRRLRAEKILEKVNRELIRNNLTPMDIEDLKAIQASADGAFGRPHIAGYLVYKGIVTDKQEAFDRYLVKCNVPKMPVSLEEAARLVRNAGGRLFLAHPNDPNGTSLTSLTTSIEEQHQIIRESMLPFLDGVECWHPRHDAETASAYFRFARDENLMVSGGSDCHQDPVILGTVDVPSIVHEQFDFC